MHTSSTLLTTTSGFKVVIFIVKQMINTVFSGKEVAGVESTPFGSETVITTVAKAKVIATVGSFIY